MGIEKKEHFVKMAEYTGGVKALQQFIKEHLTYPKAAFENKIEATIHVKYVVDDKGNVIEAKCVGNVGYGLEEEAIRVVKLLKYSSVKNRKMRVTFNKKIDIHFRLPKEAPQELNIQTPVQQNLSINYQLVSNSEHQQHPQEKTEKTITYTIHF